MIVNAEYSPTKRRAPGSGQRPPHSFVAIVTAESPRTVPFLASGESIEVLALKERSARNFGGQ